MKSKAITYCRETTRIPPFTETTLPAEVEMDGACLVEPLSRSTSKDHPYMARTLADVQNKEVYIRVANPTTAAMTIVKGTVVGGATSLRHVDICVRPPVSTKNLVADVQYGSQLDPDLRLQFKIMLRDYGHLFANVEEAYLPSCTILS